MKMFDIVVPVGPNDISTIARQIEYTKKNVIDYRNIYLISYDNNLQVDGCITIREDIFPFNRDTIIKHHGNNDRNNWYLQQLFKLYVGYFIPDIMDTYLVIDSDTFFLKPTSFIKDNKCLYCYSDQYHKPYFSHMKKLHESLEKIDENKSGICHHMIFEKKYIDQLFQLVENKHNDLFYNVFLKLVDKDDILKSGASEYEIYFNYMLKHHHDKIAVRYLFWKDQIEIKNVAEINELDYISAHWYQSKFSRVKIL